MPCARRTFRPALNYRVGLAAFAALGALAAAGQTWTSGQSLVELCRLAIGAPQCAAPAHAQRTPDLYQQRDLWLAEEALFERERAAFEAPAARASDNVARQAAHGALAELNRYELRPPAGPDAEEDAYLWLGPAEDLSLPARLAVLAAADSPPRPAGPTPALAAAAPLASAGPTSPVGNPPAVRTRQAHTHAAARRPAAPFAATPALFQLGYYSTRNGYAGRGRPTFVSVSPRPPAAAFAPHPAPPLSVTVPTIAQASPEFPV